jgi:glycosyltransferase involved in cell wall biosynthesis
MIEQIALSILGPTDFRTMYSSIKRCDVFVSSFVWNSYTLVGLFLCKLFRKKMIVWEEVNVVHSGLRFGIYHTLIRMIVKYVDAFFVCGKPQNRFLVSNGVAPEKIFVTNEYPGYVYSNVHPRPIALPFSSHEKVILYLGRLVEIKGVEYLIKAFSIVEKQSNDAALVIAGIGPLRKDLEELARELGVHRIHFAGYVPDIYAKSYLLRRSCMVVVPSVITERLQGEGGPIVVLEALSAGRPVIGTTALGSSTGLIVDGVNGYVVGQRDVEALAERILDLLRTNSITSRDVLKTFSAIKGHDHQLEQLRRAVSYVMREEPNT